MLLLSIIGTFTGMFVGGLILCIIGATYRYNKTLLSDYWGHLVSKGDDKLSLDKFLLMLLITSIGLWLIGWILIGVIFEGQYSTEESAYFAVCVPISFMFISTILYSIFYKNNSPRYPISFLLILIISCILFIISIVCVFHNIELTDWGKSDECFNIIWILFGIFIILTWLYFITFNSSKKNKIIVQVNKLLLVIIFILSGSSLICAWDIHFNSESSRKIMELDHKLKSKDSKIVNNGLEEAYALFVKEYGFNRFQDGLEGRLPDWDPQKNLFVHMYNVVYKQSQENNGRAQGIYGDYYLSYNNGNPSEYILQRAWEWWNKGAFNNDARSQCRLGDCYAGIIRIPGLERNLALADSLWIISASQGYDQAYTRINPVY